MNTCASIEADMFNLAKTLKLCNFAIVLLYDVMIRLTYLLEFDVLLNEFDRYFPS